VTASMLTKSFDAASCSVPSPATAFLTTDQTAFLWFNVTGANAGDVPSVNWYLPSGPVYQSANWDPVASAGNWCFWASIDIANNPPASSPGNWVVRVFWNGPSLFTQNFTILAPNSNPQTSDHEPQSVWGGRRKQHRDAPNPWQQFPAKLHDYFQRPVACSDGAS